MLEHVVASSTFLDALPNGLTHVNHSSSSGTGAAYPPGLRPPRPDIAIPPLPDGAEWIGEPIASIDRLVATRPVLVHFFDFAQLNSVRTLPYLRGWHERYSGDGLAFVGVHSPRFPFTQGYDVVAEAAYRLGIAWPLIVDREFSVWRLYEPHGWPALFLWNRGGALRWYHLGEGDYLGTEEAIRESLSEGNGGDHDWPPPLEPLRPSDTPDARVIPPSAELFPGGSSEQPWPAAGTERVLELDYEAGGAYAATDGQGEIAISVDGQPRDPVVVTEPGLQELTTHQRSEHHTLRLEPSPGLLVYSIQFAAGIPSGA